jgi:hypothetical protein
MGSIAAVCQASVQYSGLALNTYFEERTKAVMQFISVGR